jgi:hypothetical protein
MTIRSTPGASPLCGGCEQFAVAHSDHGWLARHASLSKAVERLFNDQPATVMDG